MHQSFLFSNAHKVKHNHSHTYCSWGSVQVGREWDFLDIGELNIDYRWKPLTSTVTLVISPLGSCGIMVGYFDWVVETIEIEWISLYRAGWSERWPFLCWRINLQQVCKLTEVRFCSSDQMSNGVATWHVRVSITACRSTRFHIEKKKTD